MADVQLHTKGMPAGWVVSFCTQTLCSPFRYRIHLNARGTGIIEFQAIRTDDSAPKHIHVTITADGAKPVGVHI